MFMKKTCIIAVIAVIALFVLLNTKTTKEFVSEFDDWNSGKNEWSCSSQGVLIEQDPDNYISGSSSWRIKALSEIGGKAKLYSSSVFFRRLYQLPKNCQEIKFGIHTKGDEVWKAKVNIVGFSAHDSISFEKNYYFIPSKSWAKEDIHLNCNFHNTNTLLVELEFRCDTLTEIIPKLWIDRSTLAVSGDRVSYNNLLTSHCSSLFDKNIQNISDVDCCVPNKKLVAIGETMHGSLTFQKTTFDLIKKMIVNNDVRNIFLELPMDLCLLWDLYISGNDSVEIDKYIPHGASLDREALKSLLTWLREYNRASENRVRILGIDVPGLYIEDFYFARYLQALENSPIIDSLISKIIEPILGSSEEMYTFLENNETEIKKHFECTDYKYFKYSLSRYCIKTESGLDNNDAIREYIMSSAVIFACDSLFAPEEKSVLYAHWNHVSKKHFKLTPKIKNSGSYLFEKYKENYHTIALIAHKGKTTLYDGGNKDGTLTKIELAQAPENSLEAFCYKNLSHNCYVTIPQNSSINKAIRHLGHFANGGIFIPTFIPNAMDAFIYLENSEGMNVNKSGMNNKTNLRKFLINKRVENWNDLRDNY